MTYGWALLVIVVVGAALFALGVLNPSTYVQKSCRGFSFFTYQDQQLTSTDFTMQILNGAQNTVITNIALMGDNTANGDLGAITVTNAAGTTITNVGSGEKVTISGAADPTTKNAGDAYTYTVTITYNVTGGISGNTDVATCSGRVQ
jgi:hypothetical protein